MRQISGNAERPKAIETNSVDDLARLFIAGLKGELLPTQREYVFSPERIKWYSGPVGCAKTSTLVASIVLPAMLYPGGEYMLSRWTYGSLEETTMKRFDKLARNFPGLIVEDQAGPPRKVWIASARLNKKGQPMEPSTILFHQLDEASKLGSQEFNGIGVDEANEITQEMANMLNDRLRFKCEWQKQDPLPDWTTLDEGPFMLNMVSNPVTHSHWLHKEFCMEDGCANPPMGKKFRPQAKENEKNLPRNYYQDIARGKNAQEIARFIEGECGPDPDGRPVFEQFIHALHVGKLEYNPSVPMLRGWDFGRRRPACVWAQLTPDGHLNILWAIIGENESTKQFAHKVKQTSAMMFPFARQWRDYGDPAGNQRKSNSDDTDITVLSREGITLMHRKTTIKQGLEVMTTNLTTLVGKRPRKMIDYRCKLLIDAYTSGYRWPETRPGHKEPENPLKDGYYEHPMDADRYLEVNLSLGSVVAPQQHAQLLRQVISPLTGR
jgi:hypothetical protein